MSSATTLSRSATADTENFDVLIVGAGISGIGGAYHLTQQCPGTRFIALESQESFGGTWLTHKYPGIRSDSDLHTFGYRFKPWVGNPIATAEEIRRYMGEVIAENDLGQHIRYHHRIDAARWSSTEKRWTIEASRGDTGEARRFTANFLWMCQGYYRHAEGYTPEWPGMSDFNGRIVHPQTWPEDLDYSDMRVIVIGSGATAATVVPAMAGHCKHVTMLQRSPTYFRTGRNAIEIAVELRELGIDETWIHEIARRKILSEQAKFTRRTFTEPEKVRQELLAQAGAYLGPDFDLDPHFTPRYRPWRQRLAFIPDGDLFQGIASGQASVVTDEIERFDATGIQLKSGKHLEADLIVTATGFNLNVLGDIDFTIDGKPLDFANTVTYRGMMRRGVVLASGGYESNAALVRNYEALPGWQSMFPPTLTGDGLVMAAEIGAAVRVIPNNLSVFLGFRNPDDAPGDTAPCRLSANQELVTPHTMVVNRAGQRFVDETFFQAVAPRLRDFDMRARAHANLPCYLIFDAQYARRNSFAGRPPGAPIPDWVARSDSLAGLAAAIGVDGAQLAATVAAFNADAQAGRDRAFGRGEAPWGLTRISPKATLGPVAEAPYFGIELHPTALASAGLVADAAARVTHVRGSAIPGLYAVGNVAARTETGAGYQTGYSLASALTFGLIAARDMVSAVKNSRERYRHPGDSPRRIALASPHATHTLPARLYRRGGR